jgi:hypothetical protein
MKCFPDPAAAAGKFPKSLSRRFMFTAAGASLAGFLFSATP